MAALPLFNTDHFESIARELGELVTGTQLDQLFASRGLADVSGQSTKWRRIQISLLARQQADRCGNHVAAFIMAGCCLSRPAAVAVLYQHAGQILCK